MLLSFELKKIRLKLNSAMQKLRKIVSHKSEFVTKPFRLVPGQIHQILIKEKDALLLNQQLTVDNSLEYSSAQWAMVRMTQNKNCP